MLREVMRSCWLLLLVGLTLVSTPASAKEALTVNIFNWVDYIGETTISDFTKATNIKVNYDTHSSNDLVEAKMLAGRTGYDLVVSTASPYFSRMAAAGLFMPLDKTKIPNYANLDPTLMKLVEAADPGAKYGIIYQWGTNGIGYNVKKIKERLPNVPLDGWGLVFNPEHAAKLADCGIMMLNSGYDILPLALQYLGLDPNSEKIEDLKKAEEVLMKIRPYIKKFDSAQYINDLANGNICLAIGFSGDVMMAKARAVEAKNGVEIAYLLPKEGTQLWFDMMAIPKDAPHPEAAHQFINFVLDPKNMAAISNFVSYPNAVPKALPLMREDLVKDPNVFPTDDMKKKFFTVGQPSPTYERQRTRSWARIVAGR
jgi:putrescine transport system substrate-binding protein